MKVCNFSLGKFFIFLCFSFISIFNLSASCVKVEDTSFVFLSQDGEECINKSESGVLPIPNGGVNNFDVLIPGKNDGGYTVELVFDRDNQVELSGEQSLFAFYSSEDNVNPVSELVLKGSSIFYKVNNTNTEDQEGVDLSGSAFNDANITNPHAIIIVHDNVDNQVIFNIDGAELKIPDVPSVNATDIKRVKIGKNYVGNISEFRVYGTELALKERAGAVKLLSGITGAKIAAIELVKDENGVTRSAVDSSDLVKCKTGQTVINGKCNNAMISGFTPPSNSIYNGGSDIQYDPAHNGQENAKLLDCDIGYEAGSTPPKYWFTLDGYVPSVRTEGSCVEKMYYLSSIPNNVNNPGGISASSLVGYSYDNPKKISCKPRSSANGQIFGVYIDENDILQLRGDCIYSGANENCYTASAGSIGDSSWDGCANMLIVDESMLRNAINNRSFKIINNGIAYTLDDGPNRIFTGKVGNFFELFRFIRSENVSANFKFDIGYWDTSSVTNMRSAFAELAHQGGYIQDLDLSGWDVSQVRNFSNMFLMSRYLPTTISIANWDTGNATNMEGMFLGIQHRIQNIALNWNTSNVTNMSEMFNNTNYNGDISGWDTSKLTNMEGMFGANNYFNGDLSNWNTSRVTHMTRVFQNTERFNGNISSWDTSNVTDMSYVFSGARAFNQDISSWNISKVDKMYAMFSEAWAFNQDISSWDVKNVTDMANMFSNTRAFNQDISSWDTTNVTTMKDMFANATGFNQDISTWCVIKIVHGGTEGFTTSSSALIPEYRPQWYNPAYCN
jgi:surface protein